ncbi:MAG TPA: ROK family transcriptional regulator, partial [Microlunatus sp.]
MNDRAALHALVRRGPMSRIELEQEIGLSKPAAAELLRRLTEADLVRQDGYRASSGPGPNARLWAVNEHAGHAVGADITATGFDVAVADLTGTVIGERKISSRGTGPDPLPALRKAVVDAGRSAGVRLSDLGRVVVGISGSIDPVTGRLGYADHMPRWLGFDVPARLTEALGIAVTVENDVNLVAIDELLHGCARGYRDVVLVWMSRGVAAALIIDGRLHRGARGAAGEIDYAPMDLDGRPLAELIDSNGVLALAQRYGVPASRASTAVRRAVVAVSGREPTPGDPDGFLGDLATRIARSVVVGVTLI